MNDLRIAVLLLGVLMVVGCATDSDSRGPDSRNAWLDATGGQFDGSFED